MAEDGLAKWIRKQLQMREWNQSDLARRLDVPTGTVSRWMQGRQPAPRYCDLLADVFHEDVDVVLSLAGHRPVVEPLAPDDPRRELHAMLDRIEGTEHQVRSLRALMTDFLPPRPVGSARAGKTDGRTGTEP